MEKPGKTEVKDRLLTDLREINKKLRRPEIPLEGSWNILRRLDPRDKYFSCIHFSSGFSQLPLEEENRGLFNIILPWGKYRYCVLPQGTCMSPDIFDINTSKNIRNEAGIYRNADDAL